MTVGIDRTVLREGLKGFDIDPLLYEKIFVDYIQLLQKWNQVYNLTAISNPNEIVVKHFFDSLAIKPYLVGQRVVDVGTGAGFPGLPLAIVDASRQFVLLDSQIKKIHFLRTVVVTFGLPNVTVVHSRVEDFSPMPLFDTVLTRAFAPLEQIKKKTRHLLAQEGRLLAMKGWYPHDELPLVLDEVCQVLPLDVPYLNEQRHLVILS